MIDPRDNQEYKTVEIAGTIWMAENLNFKTDLSLEPSEEEKVKHNLEGVRGRYYHRHERLTLCPEGWRLPEWNDWKDYVIFLTEGQESIELFFEDIDEDEHFHAVSGFSDFISLFADGNPLDLKPTGRIQGTTLSTNPDTPFADYWTFDPDESVEGTSHAHLWEVVNVHSHEHHMDLDSPDEIIRFMCRWVKNRRLLSGIF